jgi:exonuclease V
MKLSILGNILLSRSDCKSCHYRIGVVEGSWMVGIIDEIRMPADGISFQPILVDTKTRVRPTVPSEAQKRNGRFAPYCSFPICLLKLPKLYWCLFASIPLSNHSTITCWLLDHFKLHNGKKGKDNSKVGRRCHRSFSRGLPLLFPSKKKMPSFLFLPC